MSGDGSVRTVIFSQEELASLKSKGESLFALAQNGVQSGLGSARGALIASTAYFLALSSASQNPEQSFYASQKAAEVARFFMLHFSDAFQNSEAVIDHANQMVYDILNPRS